MKSRGKRVEERARVRRAANTRRMIAEKQRRAQRAEVKDKTGGR